MLLPPYGKYALPFLVSQYLRTGLWEKCPSQSLCGHLVENRCGTSANIYTTASYISSSSIPSPTISHTAYMNVEGHARPVVHFGHTHYARELLRATTSLHQNAQKLSGLNGPEAMSQTFEGFLDRRLYSVQGNAIYYRRQIVSSYHM